MDKLDEAYEKAMKKKQQFSKLPLCLKWEVCPNCAADGLKNNGIKNTPRFECKTCGWKRDY